MARVGNRSGGAQNNTKGPCGQCGEKTGPFYPVMSCSATGRKRMVRRCNKCLIKV